MGDMGVLGVENFEVLIGIGFSKADEQGYYI